VVAEGDGLGDVGVDVVGGVDEDRGLVGPGARDVARRVAAAADDEQGQAEGLDVRDARAVRLHVQVEAAQPVAAEAVGAALQDDGAGPVRLDAGADDVLEELDVVGVLDAVVERDVDGVVGAGVQRVGGPVGVEGAGAREEVVLVVLVEGDGEHAVGGPEGLLDAVAVVHVDVDVHDAGVVAEELQDAQDDVVDVAEAAGLGLLGVVQAAGPVDGDLALVVAQLPGGVDGAAGVERAVVVQAVEDGAVVAEVEARDVLALLGVLHVGGGDLAQEVEVVGVVELGHLLVGGRARQVQVHGVVHAVRHDELLGQRQAPGLHGVRRAKVVRLDGRVCVPRHAVALGARDAIVPAFVGGLAVDGEGGGARRGGVFLDDGGARHETGSMGCACPRCGGGRMWWWW